MPFNPDRQEMFAELAKVVAAWSDRQTFRSILEARSDLDASQVRMHPSSRRRRSAYAADAHPLLQRLAALMPLERGDGIDEVLVLENRSGTRGAYLMVMNASGARDHVTTFGLAPEMAPWFEQWCVCREDSVLEDTPWDRARSERRTVVDRGSVETIDPGVNRLIDIVVAAGGRTRYTCEGHPTGGYAVFEDDVSGRISDAFRAIGWRVEESTAYFEDADRSRVHAVYMPTPADVHERDALWRMACFELERELNVDIDDLAVAVPTI